MQASTNTTSEVLSKALITDLRTMIEGNVLEPGDTEYETARKVWNGMIDKRPALIIKCSSANDVRTAVKLAKEKNLVVAIKGGGHNVTGNATCDDGIMIDLSLMKKVQVDPEQMTAKAQAGATWGDFDKATQVYGLATTGGIISSTGIAGLTLGGGVGWLVRQHGMSCDNLIEAEMVTANGEIITASLTQNPDLFWALRGGGGNFGVVTSLTYRLHPVQNVLGGMIIHPMEEAKNVMQFYRRFTQTAPNELTLYTCLIHTPEGLPVIAFVGCYSGDLAKGEEVLKPLRQFGSPIADLMQVQPYTQIQTMLDAPFPHGIRCYWKSGFLNELSDDAIDTILQNAKTVASPLSAIIIELYGGAAKQEPAGGTAFPHREELFDLVIISGWMDPQEDEKNISWTRAFWDAMQPFYSHHVYVNVLGVEGAQRVKEAYGKSYERLLEVKRKYDPQNLFRLNQNIDPAEQPAG